MRILFSIAAWLVLPLALLLFAQWPLREVVQAFSREANDLAQVLFALYMAVAVTAASRAGTHLSAGHGAGMPARTARWPHWRTWALLACVAPWSLFLLWTYSEPVWRSVREMEHFGETFNHGYFLVKLALWLLVVLVLVDAVLALRRARPSAAEAGSPHG